MNDDQRFGRRPGPLRQALARRWRERLGIGADAGSTDQDGMRAAATRLRFGYEPPAGVRRLGDLAYGPHPRQCIDVYVPQAQPSSAAALLVAVHGGGWARGDKRHAPSIAARVEHWCAGRGWIVVSVNYRFTPDACPREQAADVARALAFVQAQAPRWGGDAQRVVLMGHSAGAHLAALASVDDRLRDEAGAASWSATVALDGAALDVPRLMREPHLPLFDRAFGGDTAAWAEASPTLVMRAAPPMPMLMLMVHAARRLDSGKQAQAFAQRAAELGGEVEVLPADLDHARINALAGAPGPLTVAIDGFLTRALVRRP